MASLPRENAFHLVRIICFENRAIIIFALFVIADKSNIDFVNDGLELLYVELKENNMMHICNFSMHVKTPNGTKEGIWERKYYKFTLRQIPNDTEALIIALSSGESIEFLIDTPFAIGDFSKCSIFDSSILFSITYWFPI